jgi:hypothetical protein
MPLGARLRKAAAGAAFDLGVGRLVVRDRLHVDLSTDADPAAIARASIAHGLADLLETGNVSVCVSFGTIRPNRKPVVQAIDARGRVVGYAKIAWNALTDALLAAETRTLRSLAADPPSTFVVPRVRHAATWQGHGLLLSTPLPSSLRAIDRGAIAPAMREVAERGGTSRSSAPTTPSFLDAVRRAGELDPGRSAIVGELLEAYARRSADVEVAVGAWHGDWAPWNMTRVGGRLGVYDWERARVGVPIGLDAIHMTFQVALRRSGRDVASADARVGVEAAPWLEALGVPISTWPEVYGAYLIELLLRYEDAVADGVLGTDDVIRAGLTRALGRLVGVPTP